MARDRFIVEQPKLRMDRCGNCRYYAPEISRELPETCRIQGPPTLIPMNSQQGIGATPMWPPTKAAWWCQKWEPKNKRDLENDLSLNNTDSN